MVIFASNTENAVHVAKTIIYIFFYIMHDMTSGSDFFFLPKKIINAIHRKKLLFSMTKTPVIWMFLFKV